MNIFIAYLTTFFIIFIIPFIIYGLFTFLFKIKEPDKKTKFFFGVLIDKVGTTFGFVTLFLVGKNYFTNHWFQYSFVWITMFALTEVGQIYVANSSKKEALAGIISELIYFPLAAFTTASLLH